jgi:hypothetical protein
MKGATRGCPAVGSVEQNAMQVCIAAGIAACIAVHPFMAAIVVALLAYTASIAAIH